MKKHYQIENYPYGDCVRTCLASILETQDIKEVPNFMRDGEQRFIEHLDNWLKNNNLNRISIDYDGLNKFNTMLTSDVYVVCTGKNGTIFHSVVGIYSKESDTHYMKLVHDPIKDGIFFNKNDGDMGIVQVHFFFGNDKFEVKK